MRAKLLTSVNLLKLKRNQQKYNRPCVCSVMYIAILVLPELKLF